MNILITLSVIAVAAHANQFGPLSALLSTNLPSDVRTECLSNTGLIFDRTTDKELDNNSAEEIINKVRCISFCIFTKLNMMDKDGNLQFNPKQPLPVPYNQFYDRSEEIRRKCSDKQQDPCDTANYFHSCYLNLEPSMVSSNTTDTIRTVILEQPGPNDNATERMLLVS